MNEKANILIIDDEEAIRDSFSQVLKREGYGVKAAKDGEERDLVVSGDIPILQ
ncbi:unnamed protein product [marine sediment metagenome]|uniref:Response regulatory domain-containing protein n=1 Tax=marine sediment metagenome TaxID=412755 RepID=X1U3R8_9ZZZZ